MSSAFTQTVSRPLLQTYLKCKYFKSVVSQNNRHDLNKVIQQCSRKIATLNIEPKVSLVDERIQTVIKGLKPHEKVTLRVEGTNKTNLNFASLTHYIANEDGLVDLSKQSPVNHPDYNEPDSMGIFWSMRPLPKSDIRFWSNNVTEGLFYKFDVYQDHVMDDDIERNDAQIIAQDDSVQRKYLAEGVRRIEIKEGRVRGTLFLPPGSGPFPAVINIYGGHLKGSTVEVKPSVLASRGFATLALSFFGVDDLPKSYVNASLDLDYFEEAVDLLLERDEVQKDRGVGLIGISKSGDIVLEMAAYLPSNKIKAVVAMNCMPNALVTDVDYKGKRVLSSLTISPKEMSNIRPIEGMENVYTIAEIFKNIKFEDDIASIIPFAKSKADMLMITGRGDKISDAERVLSLIKKLVKEEGKKNCVIQEYEGMGHFVDLPYDPPCTVAAHPLLPYPMKVLYGGDNKRLHSIAQEKVWTETLKFLRQSLCS